MFVTRTWRSLASVGAVITVLSTAFDPFVQQLLTYPVRLVTRPSYAASAPQAITFRANQVSDVGFKAVVNAGIWANPDQLDMSPSCPSGNCMWPRYESVGWCSKCGDVTSTASIKGCNLTLTSDLFQSGPAQTVPCGVTLDNGLPANISIPLFAQNKNYTSANGAEDIYIVPVDVPVEVAWTVNAMMQTLGVLGLPPGTVAAPANHTNFLGVDNPMMVFAHASLSPGNNSGGDLDSNIPHDLRELRITKVKECLLTLCSRQYEVSVAEGVTDVKVVSTDYGTLYNCRFQYAPTASMPSVCWQAGNGKTNISIPWLGHDPANSTICAVEGYANHHLWSINGSSTFNADWYPGPPTAGWGYNPTYSNSSDMMAMIVENGLDAVMSNIAASLTKYGLYASNVTVPGSVTTLEAYVSVRWVWFVLPCGLILAGVVFLVLTIIVSSRQGLSLWKTSVFALLYHGLERDVLGEQVVSSRVSVMEKRAETMTVRLRTAKDRVFLGT